MCKFLRFVTALLLVKYRIEELLQHFLTSIQKTEATHKLLIHLLIIVIFCYNKKNLVLLSPDCHRDINFLHPC